MLKSMDWNKMSLQEKRAMVRESFIQGEPLANTPIKNNPIIDKTAPKIDTPAISWVDQLKNSFEEGGRKSSSQWLDDLKKDINESTKDTNESTDSEYLPLNSFSRKAMMYVEQVRDYLKYGKHRPMPKISDYFSNPDTITFDGFPDFDVTDFTDNWTDRFRYKNIPRDTYLMSREDQQKAFEKDGWIKKDPGPNGKNYGLVQKATMNKFGIDTPIYAMHEDEMPRSELVPIGNDPIYEHDLRYHLPDPGDYPMAYYVHPETGKLYANMWDLNDYSAQYGSNENNLTPLMGVLSNLLDKVGSPTVVTTGIQGVYDEDAETPVTIQDLYNSETYWAKAYKEMYGNFLQEQEMKQHMENVNGTWLPVLDVEPVIVYKKINK